ncbi:MAG TPA: class I SAM-dependent methyltransferase [Syntrophales bacterium]|nr:class I SAM-dependent methyltransferase [Syntrophales bacterium]
MRPKENVGKGIKKTGERIIPENIETCVDYLLYLRHLFAYEFAKSMVPKDSLVLEVGCGEGYGSHLLSQHVKKIIGLDIDIKTINHALSKYASENCIFRTYNGINIPYDTNTFDAVISFQVIEHIQNDKKYISEIHRVLKQSSLFILTTPNREYRLKRGQRPWNRFHVREYSASLLKDILIGTFPDVTIWGIRGNDEIQKIERERVEQIKRINSLDPLYVRNLIPEQFKPQVIDFLKKIVARNRNNENKNNFLQQYTLKDFHITQNDVEDNIDLLGVCTK